MKSRGKPERPPSENGRILDPGSKPSSRGKRPRALAPLDRETVLVKLGVDKDELAIAPPLTTILSQAEGGLPAVLAAIRFSHHPEIEKFLEVWNAATDEDRELAPLEAFALKAEVDFPSFLGECILELQNQFANIVKVIAITSHPKTMRARVKNALTPGGYRDRNAIDTALRFLPQAKGATTVFNFGPVSQPASVGVHPDDVETNDLFPDLSTTQKLLTE